MSYSAWAANKEYREQPVTVSVQLAGPWESLNSQVLILVFDVQRLDDSLHPRISDSSSHMNYPDKPLGGSGRIEALEKIVPDLEHGRYQRRVAVTGRNIDIHATSDLPVRCRQGRRCTHGG